MKKIIKISIIPFLLSGCIYKEYKSGIPVRELEYNQVQHAATKQNVVDILGQPSAKTIIGQEQWIYHMMEGKILAFLDPKFTKYDVIVISFNKNKVQNITLKDLKNKNLKSRVDASTNFPAEIKLSFFQELFGHIGKFKQGGLNNHN